MYGQNVCTRTQIVSRKKTRAEFYAVRALRKRSPLTKLRGKGRVQEGSTSRKAKQTLTGRPIPERKSHRVVLVYKKKACIK